MVPPKLVPVVDSVTGGKGVDSVPEEPGGVPGAIVPLKLVIVVDPAVGGECIVGEPMAVVERPESVFVKVLLQVVYVVLLIIVSVTELLIVGVVVPCREVLDDIKDVVITPVRMVGSSERLNGGQFAGTLITSPGKIRLGSATCGFASSRQVRSTLYAIAKLYSVSPSTTMCRPLGNGKLITSPGNIRSKSEICGFSASRRLSGRPCA